MQQFMIENTLYVVLVIVLITWLGLAVYMFLIDRKIKNIETAKVFEDDKDTL